MPASPTLPTSDRRAAGHLRLLTLAAVLGMAGVLTAFAVGAREPLSPRFNHVMLYVSDLDASIAFYTEAFDLEVANRVSTLTVTAADGSETTNPVRMAFLKFPGQEFVLELSERQAGGEGPSPFYQHVGVDVTDIEASVARARAAGAQGFSGIRRVRADETVLVLNAFFQGPDGEQVELMQLLEGAF